MPGFKVPTLSRVGRSALVVVVALGGVAAGVMLALTVGAAHAAPKPAAAAPDYLLAKHPAPGFTLTDQNGAPGLACGAERATSCCSPSWTRSARRSAR